MIKNFEEFAQHQWPTWAKRRGWVTDPDQTSEAPASLMTTSDDGSGRVVQVDKDKWVFLRHRKKCTPSLSPVVRVNCLIYVSLQSLSLTFLSYRAFPAFRWKQW